VVNNFWKKLISSGHGNDWVIPIALVKGSQNTENPYAIPMQR